MAEVRAEERQVAMIMAEDRFALTLTGLFALQNAGKSDLEVGPAGRRPGRCRRPDRGRVRGLASQVANQ